MHGHLSKGLKLTSHNQCRLLESHVKQYRNGKLANQFSWTNLKAFN